MSDNPYTLLELHKSEGTVEKATFANSNFPGEEFCFHTNGRGIYTCDGCKVSEITETWLIQAVYASLQ